MLFFNESTVEFAREQPLPIPWIALISCDVPLANTTPPTLNSTNATSPVVNGTTYANTTQAAGNTTMDVFSLAASLNATAAVLYSPQDQVRISRRQV